MIKILKLSLLSLLMMVSYSANALKSDKDQPIDISADSLEMNEAKQINTYTGNVLLQQGSLTISADTLILYFDKENELDYMVMTGKPAELKQKNEENEWMQGAAEKITYRDKESLLTLENSAKFSSGNEHITSNFIQINTDNEQIQAGKKDKQNRVHMKILPRVKK